jgi:hypothetical protein
MSYHAYERKALGDASLALQADLRYAQRMAMIEGRTWGVAFDAGKNQYKVYCAGVLAPEKTVGFTGGVRLEYVSFPDMVYLPRGTGTHGMTIKLSNGKYRQDITATVSGGRIEIKDITE